MQPLDKTYRNLLERKVKDARDIAEAAAGAVLAGLGVGDVKPFDHLGDNERQLRRRLRAHGRQLGDLRKAGGEQETDRLGEEVAYEHWHRMLFARFLAENDLLMYPDPDDPVAISLEECEDLAGDEGAKNGWELAARYASQMLPQIFCLDSPVFELGLPPEHQQRLERLLADLPVEIFTASDSLGWVYQFWQAKKKAKVNASEVKIGARELPAVTQLFTEPYMVSFLLDNSLGAWWAAKKLGITNDMGIAGNSEEELREKASIPGASLEYLRFIKKEDGRWVPAAGIFDGWPDNLAELKTLDPCCGSGHFLVAALLMLVPMRMELEELSAREAVDAVLRENIHGLELDQRCVELAAFALALTAWRYPDTGGYRPLPEMHIACSGLSVSVAKDEWKQLALDKHNLRIALDWMYEEFRDAPVLGSLLNPAKGNAAKLVEWEELGPMLEEALSQGQGDEEQEMGVVAYGLAKAAWLLASKYNWVITNVPYLARGKQNETLKNFCVKNYKAAINDIATVFLDRCLEFCVQNGTASIVLPQNWLFLTSYKKFREKLLKNDTWHSIVRLGSGAFETISGEVVKAILLTMSRGGSEKVSAIFSRHERCASTIAGLDVSELSSAQKKAEQLPLIEVKLVEQEKQLENPDARIALEEIQGELLLKYSHGVHGFGSKDSLRYFRKYWEIFAPNDDWQVMSTTVDATVHFGGKEQIVFWQNGTGLLAELGKKGLAIPAGEMAWGKWGVAVSQMNVLPVTIHTREIFDKNVAVVLPHNTAHLPAIWCFCSSPEYNEAVRQIDQSLKVTNATLVKVPFDLDHWTKIAKEKYPNGLPKPYSNDPSQWVFHGHPAQADHPLHVAVARLLGYRWPAELDEEMELSDEQRAWVQKCDSLLPLADDDGIVCIPPVRGEAAAADRLQNLLADAFGDEWSTDKLSELLTQAEHKGKSLETWLRDKFFTQHCKLFLNRPFIWHIWDGLRDGFAALVNYHKLDHKTLETLIYTYLGDWINRQKDDIASGVDSAQEKLASALALKKKLELILEGESPHDIFVRWKPIDKQPIGWNPDLNDGVRLNIRPFLTVGDVKKKNAGLFPYKPTSIKWNKDRGKDVPSAPWYHLGLAYDGKEGDRVNDHHLTLTEKQKSRMDVS